MDIFGIILQDLAVFHSSVSSTNLILFIFSVSAGSSTFLGQYGRLFTRNTETVIIYCVQLVFKIFHTINYAREVHHGMIFLGSAHFIKQGPHVKIGASLLNLFEPIFQKLSFHIPPSKKIFSLLSPTTFHSRCEIKNWIVLLSLKSGTTCRASVSCITYCENICGRLVILWKSRNLKRHCQLK